MLVGLALVFACIGFVEYATKTMILNPKLIVAEQPPHVLHRQLGVLRPGHLRALPGAGDGRCWRRCCCTTARPRDAARSRPASLAVLWGGLRADAVALEPRGAAGRARDARGASLEAWPGAGRGGRGGRARRRRGRDLAEDVRAQPGAERRLERARRAWSAAASHLFARPAAVGLRIGLVRDRVPARTIRAARAAVGLAHDPDHDRRRAGADRRARVHRAGDRGARRRWSAARAATPRGRRSPPRSWRSCSTRCCTPTSSRTR